MSERCAVFSCRGLGDGLIALVLSNNLRLNGRRVTTFHPFLSELEEWFPTLPIHPFPPVEALSAFDRFFIIYEKTPWMQLIIELCQKQYPDRTTILNPIATPNKDYPYWENGRFNGIYPFVDNLYAYCRDLLQLPVVTKSNGMGMPSGVIPRRYPQRVVLHPTSSRPGKNWPIEKFMRLAQKLKERGYDPVFILTPEEKKGMGISEAPDFSGIADIAKFVAESGAMIGNDSGIGHLASCAGLPTVTICRSRLAAQFWRPAWGPGRIVMPPSWIPNIKGLRWRDRYWQRWVGVSKVLCEFNSLL